jgi:hypothetical protein
LHQERERERKQTRAKRGSLQTRHKLCLVSDPRWSVLGFRGF